MERVRVRRERHEWRSEGRIRAIRTGSFFWSLTPVVWKRINRINVRENPLPQNLETACRQCVSTGHRLLYGTDRRGVRCGNVRFSNLRQNFSPPSRRFRDRRWSMGTLTATRSGKKKKKKKGESNGKWMLLRLSRFLLSLYWRKMQQMSW